MSHFDSPDESISEHEDFLGLEDAEAHLEEEALSESPEHLSSDLSLVGQIEALLFASPKPLGAEDLIPLLCIGEETILPLEVQVILDKLVEKFSQDDAGFQLVKVGEKAYQFQTVNSAALNMGKLFASRPRPLSRAALETLTILAYRQPCTRAVVEFIRGVDSGSIIKNLLDRDLIRCVGRREDLGRPMLFGTTAEFLHVFGISSLDDLPPLSALQTDSETMATALEDLNKLEQAEGSGEIDVDQYLDDPARNPEETKFSPKENEENTKDMMLPDLELEKKAELL